MVLNVRFKDISNTTKNPTKIWYDKFDKKKSKELIPKRIPKGLRVITLQGAIEKN